MRAFNPAGVAGPFGSYSHGVEVESPMRLVFGSGLVRDLDAIRDLVHVRDAHAPHCLGQRGGDADHRPRRTEQATDEPG